MSFDWIEWVGYLASFLVLISLLMSSIIKLRWINFVGSIIFAIYGYLISSIPVAIMNFGIACINIYYLVKIYSTYNTKEYFNLLEIGDDSKYFQYFIKYYKDNIKKYVANTDFTLTDNTIGFYILRNMVPAGIFIGSKFNNDTLLIQLDYAIPQYRDFKLGKYIYEDQKDYFINLGYKNLISFSYSEEQDDYLIKMGFERENIDGKEALIKKLVP